jgi:hypothetical protein
MKLFTKAALILGSIVLSACANQKLHEDVQTQSVADPNVNLSSYSSYTWVLGADLLLDTQNQWKTRSFDLDSEVRFQVNKALREQGLQEKNHQPQLGMVYAIGINMDKERFVHDDHKDIDELKNVPEGGLVVALIDLKTRRPVWIGTGLAAIQEDNTDEQVKERLAYVIEEIFKNYGKEKK